MSGMTTGNTSTLRRKEVMMKKKPMKKMKRDPYAEGIDPSAGRGVPLSAYREAAPPKPKRKPQVSNTAMKGNKKPIKKKMK